jgi:hypothetical protein
MPTLEKQSADKLEAAVHCPNCGKEAFCFAEGIFEQIEVTVSCKSCPYRKTRMVNWPADAFYKAEVCNDVLWGWSRLHFASIRDFIASKERDFDKHTGPVWGDHRRIPAQFLDVKRRETIVRAIDRVLKNP